MSLSCKFQGSGRPDGLGEKTFRLLISHGKLPRLVLFVVIRQKPGGTTLLGLPRVGGLGL